MFKTKDPNNQDLDSADDCIHFISRHVNVLAEANLISQNIANPNKQNPLPPNKI